MALLIVPVSETLQDKIKALDDFTILINSIPDTDINSGLHTIIVATLLSCARTITSSILEEEYTSAIL